MMKKKIILVTFFLSTIVVVAAQNAIKVNDSFSAVTYMSRQEGMSIEAYFAFGDNLYAGIGESRDGDLGSFFKYSIAGNAWTKLKDFPGDTQRYGSICFMYNGKGYFGLGGGMVAENNDIWEYNPTNDNWTKFTEFPDGNLSQSAVFVINNYAYIGSGTLENGGERSRNDFWKLNMDTKEWTKIASIPQTLERASSFAIGGKGYLAGGEYIATDTYRNQILEYDPQTDAWTVKLTDANKLHFREGRAAVIDNAAYLFYGNECMVAKYTPEDNILTSLSDFIGLGEERYSALCLAHQGNIYYGLGTYNDNVLFGYAQYPRDLWKLAINPTNIHSIHSAGNITVDFDNNSHNIWVHSNLPVQHIKILDTIGKKILEMKDSQSINVSNLPKGYYIIFVQSGQEYCTQKILIQ